MQGRLPYLTLSVLVGAIASGAVAQEEDHNQDDKNPVMEFTTEAAGEYDIRLEGFESGLMLVEEPVLTWPNPIRLSKYGHVFVWTYDGVPHVIACIYLDTLRGWRHEFQSLSPHALAAHEEGRLVWSTKVPGLNWERLESADAPADSAPRRRIQMRSIARQLQARLTDPNGPGEELRLMSEPLFRYSSEESGIIDGAIFAYSQGTDPEVLFLLQARSGGPEPVWEYGVAPMTGSRYAVLREQKVLGKSNGLGVGRADMPYYNRFIGRISGSPE